MFAHSCGLDLFEAATRRMESVGARTPRLFFTDRSRRLYPGKIAVAEDVAGGTRRGAEGRHLEDKLRARYAAVEPRSEFGLLHGELGAEHTLVGPHGEPVLIDIEGPMYFDAEVDHCRMRMRTEAHRRRGLPGPEMDARPGRPSSPTGTGLRDLIRYPIISLRC